MSESAAARVRLSESLARTPLSHYVLWNGEPGGVRSNSVRGRLLAHLWEVGEPLNLRDLLRRVAEAEPHINLDAARWALRQHQAARPAVLLLLDQARSGEFRAVTDVPFPADRRALKAGEVVIAVEALRRVG